MPFPIPHISRSAECFEVLRNLEDTAKLMKLARNPTRLKLLFLLGLVTELDVSDLAQMLRVAVSRVSQHLTSLGAHDLVARRRDAQHTFNYLTKHPFNARLRKTLFDQSAVLIDHDDLSVLKSYAVLPGNDDTSWDTGSAPKRKTRPRGKSIREILEMLSKGQV